LPANGVWRKIRRSISPTKLKQKFAKNCLLFAERSSPFAKKAFKSVRAKNSRENVDEIDPRSFGGQFHQHFLCANILSPKEVQT
jgi:hypothetical protein